MKLFKYRTGGYGRYYPNKDLKKVSIDKETEKTVVIDGIRTHKRSDFYIFWDTFEGAKKHLIKLHSDKVEQLKILLKLHEALLIKFTEIKEEDLND